MAANAFQMNNIAMSSTSFFIIDGANTSQYIDFDLTALTTNRTITMPNNNVDLGNLTANSIAADNIIVGDAGILLATTVGGLSISVPTNTGVSVKIANNLQANFTNNALAFGTGSAAYTISHAASGDTQDFTISQTGANNSSIILSSAGTGTDAIALNTSAGGVLIDSATTVDVQIGSTSQASFSADGTMTLKANNPYTITHAANSASDNLSLTQTGAFDSGLYLTSAGTSSRAITLSSTAGGVSISSSSTSLGGGVIINKWTTLYGVSHTSNSTNSTTLWTADLGNDRAVYYIKATVCALDNTNSKYAAFEASALYQHDGSTTLTQTGNTVKSGIGTGVGSGAIAQLANWNISKTGDDPTVTVTPEVADNIEWKGEVTVYKTL